MVTGLAPDVMVRQADRLAADLRALTGPVTAQARAVLSVPGWPAVGEIYLTGAGDSHHASRAAAMAFETIAGVACTPVSAQFFADYGARSLRLRPGRPAVIAASASGRTPEVIAALHSARRHGARTLAITGRAHSPAARAADHSVVAELPGLERSPGIRTYQATLFALLAIAAELGTIRRVDGAGALAQEFCALAHHVEETAQAIKEDCREVAAMVAGSPVMLFLGSGPSLGTALFSAAKMTEAAGTAAMAQDIGEWWHVERRALPADMPVFIIAPPGPSHPRAAQAAAAAQLLGRRVIAVAGRQDTDVTRHASATLPVPAAVREELSPLLYHVFAGYTASCIAQRQGRLLFQGDPAGMPRTLGGFAEREGPGGTGDGVMDKAAGKRMPADPAPRDPGAGSELIFAVREVVSRHVPPEGAAALTNPDADLTDLGLDSLEQAGLIVDLETAFSVEFPDHMLIPETFRSLRAVASAIAALDGEITRPLPG